MHDNSYRWHGFKKILIGAVILANAYWPFMSWWALIGWIFVVWGFLKIMGPGYCHGCY